MSVVEGAEAPSWFKNAQADVVEITLLLPTDRAEALVDLSRRRRQSVGQLLRQLIDRALTGDEALKPAARTS